MDEHPLKPPRLLKALANGTISRWWGLLIFPAWLIVVVPVLPIILLVYVFQLVARYLVSFRPGRHGIRAHRAGSIGRMDENPYQSPREVGYSQPRNSADGAKLRDTIALWITGAICCFALVAISLFVQWLTGNFRP